MEMVREGLHDSLKAVSLNAQLVVVDYRSDFLFHTAFLLRIIGFKLIDFSISRLRDARDKIAVGQQG